MLINDPPLLDLLRRLNHFGVHYMIIGGIAVNFYGYHRHTADCDIWYDPSIDNIRNLIKSLEAAGFDIFELTEDRLQSQAITITENQPVTLMPVFALAAPFNIAFQRAIKIEFEDTFAYFIHLEDLIENKKRSGRLKDLADAEELSKIHHRKS